jgi:hypothetical protein
VNGFYGTTMQISANFSKEVVLSVPCEGSTVSVGLSGGFFLVGALCFALVQHLLLNVGYSVRSLR